MGGLFRENLVTKNFTFKTGEIFFFEISLFKISYEKRDFTFFSTKFHEKYDNFIYADQKMVKI